MLTTARTLGYVFNPITVFWAYDRAGDRTAVVAEVHNTYGGRHAYLLRPDRAGYAEADKALYVSPFYPADGRYQIHVERTRRVGFVARDPATRRRRALCGDPARAASSGHRRQRAARHS